MRGTATSTPLSEAKKRLLLQKFKSSKVHAYCITSSDVGPTGSSDAARLH